MFSNLPGSQIEPIILQFAYYFLLFILYSFGGWIVECIWTYFMKRKLENRGFLFGPICPIYGVGSLICVLLIGPLHLSWLLEFLLMVVLCDVIEYITSVVLEKIYHVRWWDYTTESKLHLNGRISIETSIGFGVGGIFILHLIQPFFSNLLGLLNLPALLITSSILFIVFVADILLSMIAISNIKGVFKGGTVDLTAEIKRFSIDYYKKASRLGRRITRTAMHHVGNAQKEAKKRVSQTFKSKTAKK